MEHKARKTFARARSKGKIVAETGGGTGGGRAQNYSRNSSRIAILLQTAEYMRLEFFLAAHEGRTRVREFAVPPDADGRAGVADFNGADWKLAFESRQTAPDIRRCAFTATAASGRARAVVAGLRWTFENWSVANYVLIPGAVYAGNRFDALRRPYPPAIRDVGQRRDALILDIGDIPRLSDRPGRSHLDQTSLDAATPAVGIFSPAQREAFLLLTPQFSSHGPIGFELIESDDRSQADLLVLAPGFLHPVPGDGCNAIAIGSAASAHLHPENARPVDLAAGQTIRFEFEVHRFPCDDVHGLFARLFAHRTAMFPQCATPPPPAIPFSAAWEILEQKHNAQNWNEARGLYQVGIPWNARPDSDQATSSGKTAGAAAACRLLYSFRMARPSAPLALASGYFGERRFLDAAIAAAAHYRDHDLVWSVTTGGPGDAVQAPDSESFSA